MTNLKPYTRRFLLLYLLCYLVGLTICIVLDYAFDIHMHDLLVVVIACLNLPQYTYYQFCNDTRGIPTELERKQLTKCCSIRAWWVSVIPMLLLNGYSILVRLLLPANEISRFLHEAAISSHSLLGGFITMSVPTQLLILAAAFVVYYLVIHLTVWQGFRTALKRQKATYT